MSAVGVQSQINKDRALWLSTIPSDVVHGNIICDTILANAGYISTLYTDNLNVSTLNASTLSVKSLDVSGMYVSSITGNFGKFSTLQWASDLSGGVGYVNITSDASGVAVTGDPIVFNNLVYLTSTINIVQVSTLIDTDIFASNGYFSTLSSGSLSTNLLNVNQGLFSSLQGDYGSFNRLFVSSLEALDISGVDGARYWSQYPTLASSITFQPGFVLSNVNNQLFFAGVELTDASGGGADWSAFPAFTDVSMNNFSLRGLSTLQYQDGARLYSQTGNNLFYNGQPVQFGAVSNVSQWANYPAVNTIQTGGFPISSLGHLNLVANSNIRLLAEQISSVADNGIDITTTSKIDLTAQNGFKGQINMTANPGFQGLFGEINMTANGGTVAGVGTGGLVSITANTPLGTLCNATSAIKLSASGVNSYAGAIPSIGSLAGYNFIYGQAGVNIVASVIPPVLPNIPLTTYLYGDAGVTTSSDLYVPNIYPYWNGLTTPPDLLISGRYIVPNLAQVYVQLSNVKHLYMDGAADIQNARLVSTISTIGSVANFNQGQFGSVSAGAVGASAGLFTTLEAGSVSTSIVTAPLVSTININLSTINGIDWQDISGGVFTTTSSFNQLFTSSLQISTLKPVGGFPIHLEGSLRFNTPNAIDNIDVINLNAFQPNTLVINASTIIIGGNNVLTTSLSTTRFSASNARISTLDVSGTFTGVNCLASNIQVSSIEAYGGLPLVNKSGVFRFATLGGLDNVDVINLNPDAIPALNIGASTINLGAVNTFTQSLSTVRHSTSALNFSTAVSYGSNAGYRYPIFIEQDHAQPGGATANDVVAIAVQGHNLATGAVRNQIEMGARGSGENYIMSLWPGQNLEELVIDATDVKFRDSDGFSTFINQNPYGIVTNGEAKFGVGSGVIEISTGLLKVGGQTNLTPFAISTTFFNLPYGNEFYMAGQRQPCIFTGNDSLPAGGGTTSTLITLPIAYTTKDFVVNLTYQNSGGTLPLYWSTQTASEFLAFGDSGLEFSWTTMGNLPFTG